MKPLPTAQQVKSQNSRNKVIKLVSDEFTAGGAKVYDYDTARDQVYTVTLSERVERVTPKDPKPQPNTPVNPGQPNTPNWPRTVERMEKLTQTITRRINFRYLKNGKAAYGTIDQHISYERNALVNLVSGDIHYEQWKITGIKEPRCCSSSSISTISYE